MVAKNGSEIIKKEIAEIDYMKLEYLQITHRVKQIIQELKEIIDNKNYELDRKKKIKLTTKINNYYQALEQIYTNLLKADETITEDMHNKHITMKLKIEEIVIDANLENEHSKTILEESTNIKNKFINNARLPTINLPTFNGDSLKWNEFFNLYEVMIHKNEEISDVMKLLYLKTCLIGEAKDILKGFQTTNENYYQAIEMLKRKYENKNLIVTKLYQELNNIAKSNRSNDSLKVTLKLLETNIRALGALGEETNQQQMKVLIMSKLPLEIRKLISRKLLFHNLTTMEVLEEIQNIIEIDEMTEIYEESGNKQEEKRKNFYTGLKNEKKVSVTRCIFCNKSHWSDECSVIKSVKERKELLKDRCFICLKNNHKTKECKSEKPCFYCKQKKSHHSSLCTIKENKEIKREKDCALIVNQGEVKLQIAKILLINPNDKQKRKWVTALFDTGCQKSFITERIAKTLNLDITESKTLKVSTFGSKTTQEIKSAPIFIEIEGKGEIIKLQAFTTEEITGDIKNQKLPEHTKEKLKNIDGINYCGASTVHIDMLIGLDNYYKIVNTERIEIEDNLYLLSTKIGKIITGEVETYSFNKSNQTLLAINKKINKYNTYFEDEKTKEYNKIKSIWKLRNSLVT